MTPLKADTVLHRAPELDLTLESNGEISIYLEGSSYRFGPCALPLINAFTRSRTFGRALVELAPLGEAACDDLFITAIQLLAVGVLRVGQRGPGISQKPFPFGFYDSPGVQIRILDDLDRRTAYLEAVRGVVRPGDIVLDLGTGSGILAVAAVRAGARHVYAIEPSNMAACARRVFERNGVAGEITLLEGWSQNLDLPERADVLTCDLVGSEPLEMRIVEVTKDALARLLKPGARMVPGGMRFSFVLAEMPVALAEEYTFSRSQFERWESGYGVDFSPMLESLGPAPVPAYVHPHVAATFPRLSAPGAVWELDFGLPSSVAPTHAEVDLEVSESGRLTAILGMAEIRLTDTLTFSTDPASAGRAPHWMVPLWITREPIPVRRGERFRVIYQYRGHGRTHVEVHRTTGQAAEVTGSSTSES